MYYTCYRYYSYYTYYSYNIYYGYYTYYRQVLSRTKEPRDLHDRDRTSKGLPSK